MPEIWPKATNIFLGGGQENLAILRSENGMVRLRYDSDSTSIEIDLTKEQFEKLREAVNKP